MGVALAALGLVLVVEGLIHVVAPSLVDDLVAFLRSLSLDQRRLAGLAAMALGGALIALGRLVGGV